MTPQLRKIHRYSWFALALVLPAIWVASIWVIPEGVYQDPVRPMQADALETLVRSKESEGMRFSLRQDASGVQQQLEVLILKPLAQANATLVLEANPEVVLGQLGARGIWRFALANPVGDLHLRVENRIKQEVSFRIVL